MAYTVLSVAPVTNLEQQHQGLKAGLVGKHHRAKALDEATMARLSNQADVRLGNLMTAINRNFATHKQRAEHWHSAAMAALKSSQTAAAAYRKDPTSKANAATVEGAPQLISDLKDDYDADALDFGQSWGAVRAYASTSFAPDVLEDFLTARAKVINDMQGRLRVGNEMAAAQKEAVALQAIVAKAKMKSGIKQGTGAQRAIGVAQAEAKAVAVELATSLTQLKTPANMTAKPLAITTGAMSLGGVAADANYLKTKRDLVTVRGFWTTTELAYKTMVTKSASMVKVLATKTRGFRSNELSDGTVKAELARAAQSVKDAKAEVKKYDKDYANAKKAIVKIEAQAKKKGLG